MCTRIFLSAFGEDDSHGARTCGDSDNFRDNGGDQAASHAAAMGKRSQTSRRGQRDARVPESAGSTLLEASRFSSRSARASTATGRSCPS